MFSEEVLDDSAVLRLIQWASVGGRIGGAVPEGILGLGADIPNLEAADRTACQGSQGPAETHTD